MQNEERSAPPALDEDTLAFARKVFEHARAGRAQELAELLDMGLPPNLLNENGDSLLMLACYHGHADAARALLAHGGDPALANDRGQTRSRPPPSRASSPSPACFWRAAPT